jgi:pimeloyl-ACP methyl ester carboxylesterase
MIRYAMMGLGLAACAPKYAELPAIEPDELYVPGELRHIDIDGVDVAYLDEGVADGEVVVFVHGLSSWMGFWEYQVPALAPTHRVLALDLPGYGASGRPDAPYTPPWYADLIVSWLDELGVERATVVGHSMGGQIAMHLALRSPDKVERLVLAAPAGFEKFRQGASRWMKDYWHEERALEANEDELRSTFTTMVFNNVDAGVERLLEERVRMQSHASFQGTSVAVSRSIAGIPDHPVRDRLTEITQPTLVVFGTDDRMIPNPIFTGGRTRKVAYEGVSLMPDADLVLLKGAGHTVHHDDPEGFNRALQRFLGGR